MSESDYNLVRIVADHKTHLRVDRTTKVTLCNQGIKSVSRDPLSDEKHVLCQSCIDATQKRQRDP